MGKNLFLILLFSIFLTPALRATEFFGVKIDTNFLHILPDAELNKESNEAIRLYQNSLFREAVILLSSNSEALLDAQLPVFAQDFCKSTKFESCLWSPPTDLANKYYDYYFPKRAMLLSNSFYQSIYQQKPDMYAQEKLKLILSPFSGMDTASLAKDPLALFTHFLSEKKIFSFDPSSNYIKWESENLYYGLIRIQLKSNSMEDANYLSKAVRDSKVRLADQGINLYASSAGLYMSDGASKSIEEANQLGIISIIGVISIILLFFRSLSPLLFSLINISASTLFGIFILSLVYDEIHIASVLLSLSLIGVLADHCIHYFSHKVDRRSSMLTQSGGFVVPYLLSLFTSLLGYALFYFSGVNILEQVSLFALSSLLFSSLNIFLFFRFAKNLSRLDYAFPNQIFIYFSSIKNRFLNFGILSYSLLAILFLLFTYLNLGINFDDDITKLQNVDPQLKSEEKIIKNALSIDPAPGFFLVQGNTENELLLNEERLIKTIESQHRSSLVSLSSWVPSKESQNKSLEYLSNLSEHIEAVFNVLNPKNKKSLSNKAYSNTSTDNFELKSWLEQFPENPAKNNYIGLLGDKYYSVVSSQQKSDTFSTTKVTNTTWIDSTELISLSFEHIRKNILLFFLIFLLSLFILGVPTLGAQRTFNLMIPPCLGALIAVYISQSYFGFLNLFSVLGIILSFFLGIDYSFFSVFSKSNSDINSSVGISVSLLTSLFSFGILVFSSTLAIQQFALSASVGILSSFLFSFRLRRQEDL